MIWTGSTKLIDQDSLLDDTLDSKVGSTSVVYNVTGSSSNGVVGASGSSGDEADNKAELQVLWEYQLVGDGCPSGRFWEPGPMRQVGYP